MHVNFLSIWILAHHINPRLPTNSKENMYENKYMLCHPKWSWVKLEWRRLLRIRRFKTMESIVKIHGRVCFLVKYRLHTLCVLCVHQHGVPCFAHWEKTTICTQNTNWYTLDEYWELVVSINWTFGQDRNEKKMAENSTSKVKISHRTGPILMGKFYPKFRANANQNNKNHKNSANKHTKINIPESWFVLLSKPSLVANIRLRTHLRALFLSTKISSHLIALDHTVTKRHFYLINTIYSIAHRIVRSMRSIFDQIHTIFHMIWWNFSLHEIRLWMMAILLLNLHIFFSMVSLYVYQFAGCSDVIIDPHQIHAIQSYGETFFLYTLAENTHMCNPPSERLDGRHFSFIIRTAFLVSIGFGAVENWKILRNMTEHWSWCEMNETWMSAYNKMDDKYFDDEMFNKNCFFVQNVDYIASTKKFNEIWQKIIF